MYDAARDNKTICALASAHGASAISVIRLSGPDSYKIIKMACPGLKRKPLESHRVYLAKFFNHVSVVDQVLVTCFDHGHSYTGEETIEISCHGSAHIVSKIIEHLIDLGALSAIKGEFTYRSFMNGRLDLVQAEAVLSVIESQSDEFLKLSLRQLDGYVSKTFIHIEDQLTWCLAHIEASIDFSTEGIDVVDNNVLIDKLFEIQKQLARVVESYSSGKVLKDGIKLVLAGQPNVGKSSLLNLLVLDDRAIVTNIAGTTRDVVQSSTIFNGLKFMISDTAGLRETTDVVESIGVTRSKLEIKNADITLFVYDLSVGLTADDLKQAEALFGKVIVVGNKNDLISHEINSQLAADVERLLSSNKNITILYALSVSALDVSCRESILGHISSIYRQNEYSDDSIITSARQFEYSKYALDLITQNIAELNTGVGSEYVAQTLKQALINIQSILGRHFDDQIMDRVFKEFCLGK